MNPITKKPFITHIGITSGRGSIHAFTSEGHAASWAAGDPSQRLVFAVEQITLGAPMRVREIPARHELEPVNVRPSSGTA